MNVFFALGWYFKLQWRKYATAITLFVLVDLLEMSLPLITGLIIDSVVSRTLTTQSLVGYGVLIVGIAIAVYILRFLWRITLFSASFYLAELMRQRLYHHLTRMAPGFFQKYRTGDLMARATNDISAVEMAAGEGVLSAIDGLMTSIFVLTIMTFIIDWKLTLIALLPFPIMAWFFKTIGSRLHNSFRDAQERFSELNDRVQESIAGIRMIKSFGREKAEDVAFLEIADRAAEANMSVAKTDSLYDPAIFLTVGTSYFLCVSAGGYMVYTGDLTLGMLTSFTMYLGYLIWPMFAYGWLMNIAERGGAAWNRISQLLEVSSPVPDTGTVTGVTSPDISIAIDRFQYPDTDAVALYDIDLRVPAGQTLGVVGHTGSGKSTLLHLLMRHYDGPETQIAISGVKLQDYQLSALRDAMAIVPQDAFLFTATIAENIAMGCPDAEIADIRRAADIADIDADIMSFRDSYETLVGERGVTLSGGQKQRIAIARALLLDAPILILDDALSAVDVGTEQRILRHLRDARKGKTTVIVSHRLTAVEHADQILVLHQGHQSETGKHRALINADGWYKRLYEYQTLERAVESGK
jgi:ATP-binding cassette subfamily B multidrug efflux pump